MTKAPEGPAGIDRRQLLRASGLTAAFGVLVAACGGGDSAEEEPGRVGYAPPITPLPTVEVNDVVYLRTATSMEQLLVQTYTTIAVEGVLSGPAAAMLDRLIEDHAAAVTATADLTVGAGGEPYECANTWYTERVVGPILDTVFGDEAEGIPPSDDPARDALTVINAMESMIGAMYQQQVELLVQPELRADLMVIGAGSARHAAAVAILATGAPDGYFSPALLGEEVVPDESGLSPLFAIPTQYGSLAPIPITIGAVNDAGIRATFALETPAANAFVYDGETCTA